MRQEDRVDGIGTKRQRIERRAQSHARARLRSDQSGVLRARTIEQVPRGTPRPHLQEFETEHVIERERRQRRLFAQHPSPERPLEPIGRRYIARCFQMGPFSLKN
jgi:hypothetical protein